MFEKASSIIKDGTKLSFDYVPARLVGREEQMDRLSVLFEPVATDGLSETAFITGSVGGGKTASAKRFCADMSAYCAERGVKMDYVLVNCRQKNTEAGVLLQLLRHFDPGFPDRGFSPSEMLRSLLALIRKTASRLVIILDEVDVLLKKNSVDLIYQLTRTNEDAGTSKVSVSLIMISQDYILDSLDEASRSSFKRANTIRFPKYGYEQLLAIVQARAEEALVHESYTPDSLEMISDIASEYGDARIAIELLDKSARLAEKRPEGLMTAEDVRASNDFIYSEITETKLDNLDNNRLFALLAIARSIKSSSKVTLAAAEKTYAVVCEEYGTEPRKHTQFWTYVQDLEKQNLIATEMSTDDTAGGRTKMIKLKDIPSKTLSSVIEEMLG